MLIYACNASVERSSSIYVYIDKILLSLSITLLFFPLEKGSKKEENKVHLWACLGVGMPFFGMGIHSFVMAT